MFILRFLGSWLLLIALIALVWDGTQSMANGSFRTTALGAHWFLVSPDSLNLAQATVKRYTGSFIWDTLLLSILKMPTWLVFGVLGVGLMMLGRKRRSLNVYSN